MIFKLKVSSIFSKNYIVLVRLILGVLVFQIHQILKKGGFLYAVCSEKTQRKGSRSTLRQNSRILGQEGWQS